jgi:hypothetical protein
MTDVTLKVRGLAGTLVRTGGAADFEYRDELTIEMESETILGQGGVLDNTAMVIEKSATRCPRRRECSANRCGTVPAP